MKKLLIALLFLTTIGYSQPSNNGNGQGQGNGNNGHPCNPHNPHCQQANAPLSGIWILILIGGGYGIYQLSRKKIEN